MEKFEEPRIIGRESELDQIRTFLSSHLHSRRGGGLYVCGRSGTGKTEAVSQIFQGMQGFLVDSSKQENARKNGSANKRAKASSNSTQLAWMSGNTAQSSTFFSSLSQKLALGTKNADSA